jgi:hypothetical protein
MSQAKAIKSLKEMSCFGIGKDPSQSEMAKSISKIEKQFKNSDSYEIAYWFGIAFRNYTSMFIRGEKRKPYLQRAAYYFEKAYALSKGVIPDEFPITKVQPGSLDRNTIACEAGSLYIDEAIIRDLERGMYYLGIVYSKTKSYYPWLCSYAEAFYKRGMYLKAAEVALELHRRAHRSPEWKDNVPPAPMGIVAKAYRAKAKECKKNGESKKAILLFQKLVDMNMATKNDQKLLKKLQTVEEKR